MDGFFIRVQHFIQLAIFLGAIVGANAQGVIPIGKIQGAAHQSPLTGQKVKTEGIVTEVETNGFYLQSAVPDKFSETSDAIYVYQRNTKVTVGNRLRVEGLVDEWEPGNRKNQNLTLTQLRAKNIRILSRQVALPRPVVLDHVLRDFPENIKTPGSRFDPKFYAMDFWESLEHMRVVVNHSMVIGPRSRYNGIAVRVARARTGPITKKGGLKLTGFDSNPARILVALKPENAHTYNTGDRIRIPIQGLVTYSRGNFKVVTTIEATAPTLAKVSARHSPSIPPGALTIATFNVENLFPQSPDEKFTALANIITGELQSPSIVGLQEIQDNSGPQNDGEVDADVTLNKLILFIEKSHGPAYKFTQINPANGADGGWFGGNIRNAFLYNPDVVNLKKSYLLRHPSFNRSEERNYTATRKPLIAEFNFSNKELVVINCHLRSKIGDSSNYGSLLPPVRYSEPQRMAQTRQIQAHLTQIKSTRPQVGIVVLGDMNDFEFSPPLRELSREGNLLNLVDTLPIEDRYTYIFQGMSQVLDHILVTPDLAKEAGIFIANVNSDISVKLRFSDHDPLLAWFKIP